MVILGVPKRKPNGEYLGTLDSYHLDPTATPIAAAQAAWCVWPPHQGIPS